MTTPSPANIVCTCGHAEDRHYPVACVGDEHPCPCTTYDPAPAERPGWDHPDSDPVADLARVAKQARENYRRPDEREALAALLGEHGSSGSWRLVDNPTPEEIEAGMSVWVGRCTCGEWDGKGWHRAHVAEEILKSGWHK